MTGGFSEPEAVDPEATQLLEQQLSPGHAPDGPAPASPSAVDALFGEEQFREYQAGLVPTESPFGPRPTTAPGSSRGPAEPVVISRRQKVLIGVAGGVVAVLALIALFFFGTRLPAILATATPSPTATATRTPTPTPTSTVKPVGPIAIGIHPWDALLGGECLNPYTSPWAEKFTVVDCAVAHPAQMVFRGTFDPATFPTFPGAAALQAQISALCAAPGVLNLAAAGQYSDAQVQGSYPVTQAEWDAGQHDYFCFVSRSSGQPLTGSVAVAAAP